MARSRRQPAVLAAIDIGSYSVHLLVGRVSGRRITELVDESAFLGLGRTIDVAGGIGSALPELVGTLRRFAGEAAAQGAASITIVGTDPLRRALDAATVVAVIGAETGLQVRVLSHEQEAFVALLGATSGRPKAHPTVLVDVGGGSTEVVVAEPDREPRAAGLQLGATRLLGAHVATDPPTADAMDAMWREASATLRLGPEAAPTELIAVGGTARSLLKVGPPLATRQLSWRRIRAAVRLMATMSSTSIAERFGVRPSRALVLPAGASILVAALERYRLEHLVVAKGGLREGLLLATARAGDEWPAELDEMLRGEAA